MPVDLEKMTIAEIEEYLRSRKRRKQVTVECISCHGRQIHCALCNNSRVLTAYLADKMQSLEEYDRTHNNGCSIYRDPNCTEPNGKH